MTLYRLIYGSHATRSLRKQDVETILGASRRRNSETGITGCLTFTHDRFLQVIEGERSAITSTFLRISSDDRHESVDLIGMQPIERRLFSEWSMGYVAITEANKKTIMEYSVSGDLDSTCLSFETATALLRSLAGGGAVPLEGSSLDGQRAA